MRGFMDLKLDKRLEWIKRKVEQANAKGLVFGLSGGIDSAVVAALAKRVFPENSLGLIMPCESIEEDEQDARLIANSLNLKVEKVDLTSTYQALLKASFESKNPLARANIKPRLRMTSLYYYAQDLSYLVAGGSNASELYLGYFTKHGDSGVDILPIADLVKEDVFKLAKELNIPEKIINRKPSAGLWKGQTDEDEMGFSYREIDGHLKGEKINPDTLKRIKELNLRSEHKRAMAPSFSSEEE
ncbi:NAD+ synthase [Clostridiales bacterium KA00134]|nr:NAD+ synthase [Clostridiales bacterium KA00134]